jgi:hypothetical protein
MRRIFRHAARQEAWRRGLTNLKLTLLAFLFAAFATAIASTQSATGAPPFYGRLYRAVSSADRNLLAAADARHVPPSVRPRFQRFVKCHATFRSRLPAAKDFFTNAALPKRRAMERAIACLSEAPGIAKLATDYAARARILYEWEGLSSSPLEEAAYAEQYLGDVSDSPIAPYLYLFIAERARYAYEFLTREGDPSGAAEQAAQYRTFIVRARQDPLVALVADDLDGLAFLRQDVGKHPKAF